MTNRACGTPLVEGLQPMFVGPSGRSKSMLEDLTTAERVALSEWSGGQRGDPERGGVVDLGLWPGWEGVLARRFKEGFGVEMPKAGD